MELFVQILVAVIFLAACGHIVYDMFFSNNYPVYTVDYFKQKRLEAGRPAEATDEELEETVRLLDEILDTWPVVGNDENGDLHAPLRKREVKSAETMMKAVLEIAPTDEEVVEHLNGMCGVIKAANKRKFNGSKTLIICSVCVYVLIVFMGSGWATLPFLLLGVLFYFAASMTPQFVLNRREMKGNGGKPSFMSGIIGGLFGGIATARTVKYVDKHGNTVDTDHSETWIMMAITFIAIFMLAVFIIFIGIINYIRNYWLFI